MKRAEARSRPIRFRARIRRLREIHGGNPSLAYMAVSDNVAGIALPDCLPWAQPEGRVAIRLTILGKTFRTSAYPASGGKHAVCINLQMKKATGARIGRTLAFKIERDDKPRLSRLVPDLRAALVARNVLEAYRLQRPSCRREWMLYLLDAKKPETRALRAEQIARALVRKARR